MAVDDGELPLLWHLKVSNYNEKVRWALDHKRVPHRRRAAAPGWHQLVARRLSGGTTFPVLVLDGEALADSSQIVEALERRNPEPPLYPAAEDERRHALRLEDDFDEQLGPYVRRLLFHLLLPQPRLALAVLYPDLQPPRRMLVRAGYPLVRAAFRSALSVDAEGIERAWQKLQEGCERFRAEVGRAGYLVGDSFSVADLTLAALLSPAVTPEQYPYEQPQRGNPALAPLLELLDEYRLREWAVETYARHRGVSAEVAGDA